jgi:putative ABC transport system permease protein
MLKNYLLITFRSMMKNKLFVLINVLGMGVGIALCIVSYLNWSFRHNWDGDQVNAERIYRIQFWHESHGELERYGLAPMPLAKYIQHDINGVDAVVKFLPAWTDIRIGDQLFSTPFSYADSSFFDVFTLDLKYGVLASAKNKSQILISDELAKKYFNKEDVVGEQITQINNGIPREFTVGGVFKKLPLNSSFMFEAITLWSNYWDIINEGTLGEDDWKEWNTTFLMINDPTKAESVTGQLQRYVEPQNIAKQDFKIKNYYLESFKGIVDKNTKEPRIKAGQLRSGQPYAVVFIPAIMSALLLLLACFNFTNTSIAMSSQRLKEIGIRKVMGSLRKQLVIQFLGENLLLCFFGFVAGLFIAELLVPAYDTLWPWLELHLSYIENANILLFLFCLLILTALVAGGYPAFYVTSFEPIKILKGKTALGGTSWLTRILLGGQFAISLITIVLAVGFYHNAKYQETYDLGFKTTGVISVHVAGESEFNTYRDALSSNKDIIQIAGTRDHLGNSFSGGTVKYESKTQEVDIMDIGDQYMESMEMKLLQGRGFMKDSETDRNESVLVSEEFVRQFGWTGNPIGKRIVWRDSDQLYVIGVVKDIYANALWLPLKPMMLRYIAPNDYSEVVVSVSPGNMKKVDALMKQKWQEVFPNSVYYGKFIDQVLEVTKDTNKTCIIIFGFLGIIACLMSATGLFTLVSLTIIKRTKEIGIRKVLGASVIRIVGLISFEFVAIILVASVLGGAIGYYMVDVSMDAVWEYYEKVNFLTLATSTGIILLLAALTVGLKTINTAQINPVMALRTE